ncbi:hypothetical protein NQ176_g53 [Zarea fungicola]|uniref:Uncharacterized protein n=1 Tax=Zarea fungicola TaxID=93591 RepID=A0ACC1NY76_9HYPO|nr:hypothetical protein NQ176_g53 [Lecanicillium fungicola]
MIILIFALFASFAAADGISLQLFDGPSCNQNSQQPDKVVANVNTNSAGKVDTSGCFAAAFKSARVISFTEGFKCNVYRDSSCKDFSQSITAQDGCDAIPGSSVLCFNQAAVDNPFAQSKVSITVGSKEITVNQDTPALLFEGIGLACGDTGCDPTNKRRFPFQHFNQDGFESISLTGSYENVNQRDYMRAILGKVVSEAAHGFGVDTTGSTEGRGLFASQYTFFQIVIRDKGGSIQAQMTATIDVTTQSTKEGDCGIVGQLEKLALKQIPAIGGLLASSFDFVCKKAG